MPVILKKLFFTSIFNFCLFFLLIIGIQNSSNKSKVNFLLDETINLPVSFIIGSSFIGGSIVGSLLTISLTYKKNAREL